MISINKRKTHWSVILLKWLVGLTLLGVLFLMSEISVKAIVSLLYFSAISENQQVRLVWETASEFDNAGFFVQRSNQREGGYARRNSEIIQAKGSDFTGAVYEYLDTELVNNAEYWYRLESLDLGQHSQFSDPVRAIVGATATPTTPPTSTVTRTPTITPEGFVASQTPTPTFTRTSTVTSDTLPTSTRSPTGTTRPPLAATQPYPGPEQTSNAGQGGLGGLATPSPVETTSLTTQPDINASQQSVTATLIPFPTITIIFSNASTAVALPIPTLPIIENDGLTTSSFLRYWPFGLLIIIWFILVAWFYLSHRRHN
jgi:hypothetical protein